MVPSLQKLLQGCRDADVQVIHTTVESLTEDGREMSLDYKVNPRPLASPPLTWPARKWVSWCQKTVH